MKTPIEIRPSPCPSQAARRLACKISPPYVAPLSSSSRAHVMTQVAYLVDLLCYNGLQHHRATPNGIPRIFTGIREGYVKVSLGVRITVRYIDC